MDPTMAIIQALLPILGGGIVSAIPGGNQAGNDWWSGSTSYSDSRRGRDQNFYSGLMGQQRDQYAGIQSLLDAIGQNTAGYTQDIGRLNQRLNPYEDMFRNLGNQIAGYTGQFENLQNQLATQGNTQLGIMRQMNDPASYLRYMTNLSGQSNNLAEQAFKNQFGDYQTNAAGYTENAANAAREAAASQMARSGLLGSGAALDAISGAGVTEQLKAAQELAGLRGQQIGQTYNNLMGLGAGAYQTQASNAVSGMNALTNLFGQRANILGEAVNTLGQTGNQYGNAANIINALINSRNQQAGVELGALGQQLGARQNLWGSLFNANNQDQQYQYDATRSGGLRDFLLGLFGGSGQMAGMGGQAASSQLGPLLQQLLGGQTGNVASGQTPVANSGGLNSSFGGFSFTNPSTDWASMMGLGL